MTTTTTQLSRGTPRDLRPVVLLEQNDASESIIPNDARSLAFVAAPIILHGAGGWETDVPDWMRDALPVARWKYLRDGGNPDLVCALDAVLHLMSASLCQPLGSDWTRIYLFVAFKVMRELGHVELPDDDWVRDAEKPLSRYEQQMLDHLRGQIRRAQVKHAKTSRTSRRVKPSEIKATDENASHELSPAERGEKFEVPTFGLDRDPKDPGPNGMPDDVFEPWAAALEKTSPAAIAKIRAEREAHNG
jgi:hypothetical protein